MYKLMSKQVFKDGNVCDAAAAAPPPQPPPLPPLPTWQVRSADLQLQVYNFYLTFIWCLFWTHDSEVL